MDKTESKTTKHEHGILERVFKAGAGEDFIIKDPQAIIICQEKPLEAFCDIGRKGPWSFQNYTNGPCIFIKSKISIQYIN